MVKMTATVYGNAVTSIIRDAFDRGDLDAVAGIAGDVSFADVLAVCKRKAEVVGDSDNGFEVKHAKEKE